MLGLKRLLRIPFFAFATGMIITRIFKVVAEVVMDRSRLPEEERQLRRVAPQPS